MMGFLYGDFNREDSKHQVDKFNQRKSTYTAQGSKEQENWFLLGSLSLEHSHISLNQLRTTIAMLNFDIERIQDSTFNDLLPQIKNHPMDHSGSNPREFDTTHWSLVSIAQSDEANTGDVRAALEKLCRAYWYPLYSFARRQGRKPEDAQDLTQSFLIKFIETNGFASADRQRGRFRTYLLGAMKHFMANDWRRHRAAKRGGNVQFLEWDALDPESRFAHEPAESEHPDLAYDREWALELLERAKRKLKEEAVQKGKLDQFHALRNCLTGTEPPRSETAVKLGMTEGAVKSAVLRMRQRFRDLLRSEIAETVQTRDEINDEMQHLLAVLRKK